jgi:hypothetical protein
VSRGAELSTDRKELAAREPAFMQQDIGHLLSSGAADIVDPELLSSLP